MSTFYEKIENNKNKFVTLGEAFKKGGKIIEEIKIFLDAFKVNSKNQENPITRVHIYRDTLPFLITANLDDNWILHYLNIKGELNYDDLIYDIHLINYGKTAFSNIQDIELNILEKFRIICNITKPNKQVKRDKDLIKEWKNIQELDEIQLHEKIVVREAYELGLYREI